MKKWLLIITIIAALIIPTSAFGLSGATSTGEVAKAVNKTISAQTTIGEIAKSKPNYTVSPRTTKGKTAKAKTRIIKPHVTVGEIAKQK